MEDFIACPHNLANNRQTRMLSNLSLVGCYNQSVMSPTKRDAIMLQSAKDNLREMAFFGMMEYQRESQYLFETTFHLQFSTQFEQYSSSHATGVSINNDLQQRVRAANQLDMQLYQYAKHLFMQRYNYQKAKSEMPVPSETFDRKVQASPTYSLSQMDDDEIESDESEYNDVNTLRIERLSSKLKKKHRS